MKLQAVAIALLVNFHATLAEDSSPAPCCSEFDAECYTVSNNRSNSNACSEGDNVCENYCTILGNSESEACKACCITFPHHDVPWNCPAQRITCLATEYGVGNYSDYYSDNAFACRVGDGDASVEYELGDLETSEKCMAACEATGLPGCCSFEEKIEANVTTVSDCQFVSGRGNNLTELMYADGVEPRIIRRRRLAGPPFVRYFRGVRCDADSPTTNSPGTDSPSTDEPTSPGSDGGSSQLRVSFVALVAVLGTLGTM